METFKLPEVLVLSKTISFRVSGFLCKIRGAVKKNTFLVNMSAKAFSPPPPLGHNEKKSFFFSLQKKISVFLEDNGFAPPPP